MISLRYFLVAANFRAENYPYLCNVQSNDFMIEGKEMDKEKIEAFGRMIEAAGNVVLVGHFNPDGDAIGSTVARKPASFTRTSTRLP